MMHFGSGEQEPPVTKRRKNMEHWMSLFTVPGDLSLAPSLP